MYDLFSDFADFFDGFDVYPVYRKEAVCPKCGRSYSEFKHSGRLGCPKCYEAFSSPIESTLKQIHGNTQHKGKVPTASGEEILKKRKADELKKQISKAVADEDYETAAKLHKELKKLGL